MFHAFHATAIFRVDRKAPLSTHHRPWCQAPPLVAAESHLEIQQISAVTFESFKPLGGCNLWSFAMLCLEVKVSKMIQRFLFVLVDFKHLDKMWLSATSLGRSSHHCPHPGPMMMNRIDPCASKFLKFEFKHLEIPRNALKVTKSDHICVSLQSVVRCAKAPLASTPGPFRSPRAASKSPPFTNSMPPKRSNKTLKKKLYKTNQNMTKEEHPASNMAVMDCNGSWNWVDVWPKCRMPKKIQSRFVASTQPEKKKSFIRVHHGIGVQ